MTTKLPEPGSIGDIALISIEEAEPGEWLQLRDISFNIGESPNSIRSALRHLVDADILVTERSGTGHSMYSIKDRPALNELRAAQISESKAKAKAFREAQAAKKRK